MAWRTLSSGDHLVLGFARRAYEISEQVLRERVIRHSFRMPLHADNPVFRRIQFHTFNNSVGATSGDPEIVSRPVYRLVMAAVDVHLRRASHLLQITAWSQSRAMLQVFGRRACRKVGFAMRVGAWFLAWNVL